MNLVRKSVRISPTHVRYFVRLEGEDTAMGSFECWHDQAQMLKAIVDTPDLLFCGPSRPTSIKMYHSGAKWIIEAEALVEEGSPTR